MKTGSPYLLSSPLGKSESSSQRETWTKMSANCHSYWLQLSESVKPHWCYAANSFIAFWCIGCVQSVFCHKKAQNAVRATRCHWLFQSSMVACSGRPDNKKGSWEVISHVQMACITVGLEEWHAVGDHKSWEEFAKIDVLLELRPGICKKDRIRWQPPICQKLRCKPIAKCCRSI